MQVSCDTTVSGVRAIVVAPCGNGLQLLDPCSKQKPYPRAGAGLAEQQECCLFRPASRTKTKNMLLVRARARTRCLIISCCLDALIPRPHG